MRNFCFLACGNFQILFNNLEHCVADNAGERNRDAQGKSRPTHCMIYKCRQRAKTGQENKLYWIMNLGFSIVKSNVKSSVYSVYSHFFIITLDQKPKT